MKEQQKVMELRDLAKKLAEDIKKFETSQAMQSMKNKQKELEEREDFEAYYKAHVQKYGN